MKPKTQNWINLAQEDYEVAVYLFRKRKYLHCLFFCQQTIEKAFKAVYYEKYNQTPPRKHDLEALADMAGVLTQFEAVSTSTACTGVGSLFLFRRGRPGKNRKLLAGRVKVFHHQEPLPQFLF